MKEVNAFKIFAAVDGPAHGVHADIEFGFKFFEQVERVFAIAVHFVDEDDDGGIAHPTDFHQSLCLFFHAFHAVDDQDNTVNGSERAIGVLGEVFVSGRIQDVDPLFFVVECHHRGGHRDSPLFFNFHEIRGGGFVDFVVFYGTGGLDLATEEQKFLCEGGFSGIGVGDDGKGFAFGDFGFVHEL